MKTRFLRHLALLALPLLPISPAAATVNPAIVAADAQWLVHVDLNALRESAIGKELIAMAEKAQLDTAGGKVGIDWNKLSATIGTATAYGTTLTTDPKQLDGALLFQGTPELRKIAESILIQANLTNPKEVAEITDLPFPAYALRESKKAPAPKPAAGAEEKPAAESAPKAKAADAPPFEVVIAFPPEPVVLVSKSKAHLLKARDVFRGAAPSLAKNSGSALGKFLKSSDGAYLFVASMIPAETLVKGDGPQTRILKMASSGSLAIGERSADTFARADLIASNDQMAEKLLKIVQGMTAMMSLAETNDKQLAEFLNSAAVSREGKTVSLSLAYNSARLAQMIKSLQQTQASPAARQGPAPITSGKALAQWTAEAAPAGTPLQIATRTLENVALTNGAMISLGRASNGGKNVKFDRLEISSPAGGPPMIFKSEFMRAGGPRGNLQQVQFPGADGDYTLKVSYQNDPDGKAAYAVSVRNPPPAAPAAKQQ
ncbi:MAG: hypothetical protein HZA93_02620 [Verrucomicrobia bacterium]|nr:hypothetical protein [Verrucomicrobiota bacterium]